MHDAAEHAVQQESATSWLTIAEAAAALGVSVDTVRRRLKRGELHAEQVPTERGPVWRVAAEFTPSTPGSNAHSLPSVPGTSAHGTPGVPSSAAEHAMHEPTELRPELLKALEMLESAQADVVTKAEAAAMWQVRAELLAVQLQQREHELADLRDELRALQAPSAATAEIAPGSPSANGAIETTQTPAEVSKRAPWWAPWRRATS